MTKEEAIKGLKENLCSLCAYGSQNMDSCDIRGCDNRDYIKALEQQPSDCVSRQAVLDKAWDVPYDGKYIQVVDVGDIQELPPVTPTRKSGLRWIERFDNEDKWLECPHCHKDSDNAYAYCPNCGASFKEEKRGNGND